MPAIDPLGLERVRRRRAAGGREAGDVGGVEDESLTIIQFVMPGLLGWAVAIFIGLGAAAFGLTLAGSWWMTIPLLVVGTLCFMAIGLLAGAVAKSTEGAVVAAVREQPAAAQAPQRGDARCHGARRATLGGAAPDRHPGRVRLGRSSRRGPAVPVGDHLAETLSGRSRTL